VLDDGLYEQLVVRLWVNSRTDGPLSSDGFAIFAAAKATFALNAAL
jgi:hypothetical protein